MKDRLVRIWGVLLILVVSIGALSCVKSSTSSGTIPGPGPNTINMGDNFFSPAVDTFMLSSGSVTINWKNNGGATHTATSDVSGVFDTGDITTGQTKSITFTSAGSYPYHCKHHAGMNGTVVIQ